MILIFGGAYQGKLAYAFKKYGLDERSVYRCSVDDTEMPRDKEIIYEIDKWVLALIRAGYNGEKLRGKLTDFEEYVCGSDAVIICNDISCGVVPVDSHFRLWREAVGRMLAVLSENSERVVRLFCGIPTIIK